MAAAAAAAAGGAGVSEEETIQLYVTTLTRSDSLLSEKTDAIHKLLSLTRGNDDVHHLRAYWIGIKYGVLTSLVDCINLACSKMEAERSRLGIPSIPAFDLLFHLYHSRGPTVDHWKSDDTVPKEMADTPGMVDCLKRCKRLEINYADTLLAYIQSLSSTEAPPTLTAESTKPPSPTWETWDVALAEAERRLESHTFLTVDTTGPSRTQLEEDVEGIKKERDLCLYEGHSRDKDKGCSVM